MSSVSKLGRTVPKVPNSNTRRPMLHLIPLHQDIQLIRRNGLDEWGNTKEDCKPEWHKCKVQYSNNRFFLRQQAGYEDEGATYVFLHGKVKVDLDDILRYQYPDGDFVDFQPQTVSYTFDISGGVFMTKVWCK